MLVKLLMSFWTVLPLQKRSWNLKDPGTWAHPKTPWTMNSDGDKKETGTSFQQAGREMASLMLVSYDFINLILLHL